MQFRGNLSRDFGFRREDSFACRKYSKKEIQRTDVANCQSVLINANDSSMHNAEEEEDDDDERIIFHLIF